MAGDDGGQAWARLLLQEGFRQLKVLQLTHRDLRPDQKLEHWIARVFAPGKGEFAQVAQLAQLAAKGVSLLDRHPGVASGLGARPPEEPGEAIAIAARKPLPGFGIGAELQQLPGQPRGHRQQAKSTLGEPMVAMGEHPFGHGRRLRPGLKPFKHDVEVTQLTGGVGNRAGPGAVKLRHSASDKWRREADHQSKPPHGDAQLVHRLGVALPSATADQNALAFQQTPIASPPAVK